MAKLNYLVHAKCKYVIIIRSMNTVRGIIPFEWQLKLNFSALKVIETAKLCGRFRFFHEIGTKYFDIGFYCGGNKVWFWISNRAIPKWRKAYLNDSWVNSSAGYRMHTACHRFKMKSCRIRYAKPRMEKRK